MSYTVTEATVVFPDKKAASSFSSGYASKKPCAHIDCELEGGFERSIWIPVRVARLYVKTAPIFPVIGTTFVRRCSSSSVNVRYHGDRDVIAPRPCDG